MNNRSSRIHIVGSCGCGKSTLSYKLSKKLNIEHIELDDLFWLPGWNHIGKERLYKVVEEKLNNKDSWIISGNYSNIQTLIHQKCDTIIWLDYSFLTVLSRLFYRTFRRVFLKEECCNGNRESLIKTFLDKESIILWMISNFKRRKRFYSNLKNELKDSDINFIHLTKPSQVKNLLKI